MNRQQYLELHRQFCEQMIEITKKKNSDYSSGEDPFRNFRAVGALGLSVEQGFLTRMSDKMSRLANFTIKGSFAVSDESFEDTCLDLANYALLLAGYMRSERANKLLAKDKNGTVYAPCPDNSPEVPQNLSDC